MTTYYYVEPEVAGQLGEETEMDRSVHPPKVTHLQYEFHGWLGDDLLTTVSNYIVSEELMESITSSELTGCEVCNVEVAKSDEFKQLQSDTDLPDFYWLRIIGKAGEDDFGIADNNRLVVSEDALLLLEDVTIDQAKITEYDEGSKEST